MGFKRVEAWHACRRLGGSDVEAAVSLLCCETPRAEEIELFIFSPGDWVRAHGLQSTDGMALNDQIGQIIEIGSEANQYLFEIKGCRVPVGIENLEAVANVGTFQAQMRSSLRATAGTIQEIKWRAGDAFREPHCRKEHSAPQRTLFHDQEFAEQHCIDWGTTGCKRLGGETPSNASSHWDSNRYGVSDLSADELRQRACEAAERRQNDVPGVSRARVAAMHERQQKEKLLGRITEQYQRHGLDLPLGLPIASLQQLQKHSEALQKDVGV